MVIPFPVLFERLGGVALMVVSEVQVVAANRPLRQRLARQARTQLTRLLWGPLSVDHYITRLPPLLRSAPLIQRIARQIHTPQISEMDNPSR